MRHIKESGVVVVCGKKTAVVFLEARGALGARGHFRAVNSSMLLAVYELLQVKLEYGWIDAPVPVDIEQRLLGYYFQMPDYVDPLMMRPLPLTLFMRFWTVLCANLRVQVTLPNELVMYIFSFMGRDDGWVIDRSFEYWLPLVFITSVHLHGIVLKDIAETMVTLTENVERQFKIVKV